MTINERIEQAAEATIPAGTRHTIIRRKAFVAGANFAIQNQWISINEELPKKDKDNEEYSVPVFVIGGHHKPQSAIYSYKDKKFISCGIFLSSTHWMHIPSI